MNGYQKISQNLTGVLAGVFCMLLLVSLPAIAGQETRIEGILHVQNGDKPDQGAETMNLSEIWRAGGDDDEESIFGIITQVRVDQEMNTYLLDTQLSEVLVYDPAGEMIKTLSREGDGPGEVRTPIDMVFLPDGSLGILQAFPGRVIKVDLNGDPAGEITLGSPEDGGMVILIDAFCSEDQMVFGGTKITQGEGQQVITSFIASFNEAGEELIRFEEGVRTLNFADFKINEDEQYFPVLRHWTISPDRRLYTAPERNEYVINVYNLDGSIERVIERKFDVPPRTDEEIEVVQNLFDAQMANVPIEVDFKMSDNEPVITSLFVDARGLLWVEHCLSNKNQPDGIMRTYDVFDTAGNLIKQVAIECEGNGKTDGLIFAGEERVLLVKGYIAALRALSAQGASIAGSDEDEGPMEVVCFSR